MPLIQFGDFEFDDLTFELRRNGAPARIQQQPARVLAFLLSRAGSLVTRDDIRQAIWGTDTFVDFEQGLNFCIRQIRITLADQAEKPSFIETLPRLGYRFIAPITAPTAAAPAPAATSDRRRIRIGFVPIEPLGSGVEDYFAVGLSEDMISALSRIDPSRMRVAAGLRLVNSEALGAQLERLQREFNLDYLLRGTVRRSGETIRISAQLHDLRDRSVLWSETYDRQTSDLLAVQEDVTRRVSQSLALELLPGETSGSRRYASSSAAYDAYLKGRYFWHKMTAEAIGSSLTYFHEALAIDPAFAPAYAGLADCYAQMGSIRVGIMKPLEAVAQARIYLQRAMDLDDTLAEAHCTLALIKSWYDLDWAGAEREFQIALNLDGSLLTALLWQSLYLAAMGRHEEAIASARRARDTEPLSPVMNMYLGVALMNAGQYDLAMRQFQLAIELDPLSYRPHMFMGRTYVFLGRYDEAVVAFQQALERNPENLEALAYIGCAKAESGDRKAAIAIAQQVLAAGVRTDPSILLGSIYASLGDADELFPWLDRARDARSTPIYLILIDPNFRRFESDPRYAAFRVSLGLPPYRRT
jgi:TolB-like protein/Tfp pilus assembly protein PilF